jgi:hypothetical protein
MRQALIGLYTKVQVAICISHALSLRRRWTIEVLERGHTTVDTEPGGLGRLYLCRGCADEDGGFIRHSRSWSLEEEGLTAGY